MTGFTSALLQSAPAVAGLDRTIVIPARRLHLTLGVVSLDQPGSARANAPPPTLAAARALLESLRPRVLQMLRGQRLRVGLERMDVLQPERGDASRAHVLFVGPVLGGEDGRRLRSVCGAFVSRILSLGSAEHPATARDGARGVHCVGSDGRRP